MLCPVTAWPVLGSVPATERDWKPPCCREFGDFDRELQRNTAFGQDDRRIAEAHAERLELDRDLAFVLRDRNREFAADKELAGFARDRRKVRLGERAHDADAFERVDRCADRALQSAADKVLVAEVGRETAERGACDREGVRGGDREVVVEVGASQLAEADRARQVDAELLDHRALHLDEADFQRHLVLARRLVIMLMMPFSSLRVWRARAAARCRRPARFGTEPARMMRPLTGSTCNFRVRHVALDEVAELVQAGDAVRHRNLEHLHLAAGAIEEHDVALDRRQRPSRRRGDDRARQCWRFVGWR